MYKYEIYIWDGLWQISIINSELVVYAYKIYASIVRKKNLNNYMRIIYASIVHKKNSNDYTYTDLIKFLRR